MTIVFFIISETATKAVDVAEKRLNILSRNIKYHVERYWKFEDDHVVTAELGEVSETALRKFLHEISDRWHTQGLKGNRGLLVSRTSYYMEIKRGFEDIEMVNIIFDPEQEELYLALTKKCIQQGRDEYADLSCN